MFAKHLTRRAEMSSRKASTVITLGILPLISLAVLEAGKVQVRSAKFFFVKEAAPGPPPPPHAPAKLHCSAGEGAQLAFLRSAPTAAARQAEAEEAVEAGEAVTVSPA